MKTGWFLVGVYWTGFREACEVKAMRRLVEKCGKAVGYDHSSEGEPAGAH